MAAVDSFQFLYRELARSCSCYVETLALVGALYTAGKAVVLVRNCYSLVRLHFIPRLLHPRDLVHQYGKWAVINGASEAIGKAFAEELARYGVCIILISSDVSSVSDVAKSISEVHGVEVLLVTADFTHGPAMCKPIKDAIRHKDVGFVVNCLDSSHDVCREFLDMSESTIWQILSNNVTTATLVTRLALPGMAERQRGAVVNILSGCCSRPTPRKAMLSASMAFLDHFSLSLHYEYGHQGIFVQSLVPCRVASKGEADMGGAGWLVPHPQVYARHALSTLGISHRTTGYWPHTLQFRLMQCIPEWIWILGNRVLCRTT